MTADNLVALWEKHIEGKAASHVKRSRTGRPSTDPTTDADGKESKKRKRTETQDGVDKADGDGNGVVTATATATATQETSKDRFDKRKQSKHQHRERQAAGDLPPSRSPASASASASATASAPRTQSQTPSAPAPPSLPPAPPPPATKLTPLQVSMRQKLVSARFRYLNQTLYTSPSTHSLSLFAQNPQMFGEYHEGFRKQVEVWPENPVDGYVQALKQRGKKRFESQKGRFRNEKKSNKASQEKSEEQDGEDDLSPLPRTDGLCTIADLGCGDAKLALALNNDTKKLKLKVLSYDLQSPNPLVTQADIAHLPLADGSVDIAIFCLALMGTNWIDFVEEAWRLLHWKGELWVAEIKSRFGRVRTGPGRVDHSVGNKKKAGAKSKAANSASNNDKADVDMDVALIRDDIDGTDPATRKQQETDISAFVEVLRKRGFVLKHNKGKGKDTPAVDMSNKMFVKMEFVKALTPIRGKGVPSSNTDARNGSADGGSRQKWARPKFVERDVMGVDGEMTVEEEAKVLKPCVYKLR